jgi:hypothetical protein
MRQSPVSEKGLTSYRFLLADTRFLTGPFPERPWYQRKEEPSFGDMLTTLRRLSWKNNYGDIVPKRGRAKKLFDQITWILCLAG